MRRRNEDAILARDDIGLWLVADGLGGHAAGDAASRLVVQRLVERMSGARHSEAVERVEAALADVNEELRTMATRLGVRLVGSTVVLLVEDAAGVRCGWSGDSRCYALVDGRLHLLTRDHVVGGGAALGGMPPPAGHAALTHAIGAEPALFLDWVPVSGPPGARFLLCSDGLNKELSDAELEAALGADESPQTVVDALVDLALRRGARDNVSAIVIAAAP